MARAANRPNRKEGATGRPRRSTATGRSDILDVRNTDDEYTYRWVNDVPGRVQEMQDYGYEVADGDEIITSTSEYSAEPGSVKRKSVGKGVTAVLMKQRKDFYEEDQQAKAEDINRKEATLHNPSGVENSYGGKLEIK